MKIKQGFMSNSSSSSFMIAAKACPSRFQRYIDITITDFKELVSKYIISTWIDNVDELCEYITNSMKNEQFSDTIHKMQQALLDGKNIYIGSIDRDTEWDNYLEGVPEPENNEYEIIIK